MTTVRAIPRFVHLHRGLAHGRVEGQGGLDLGRLDAEAAHLDLAVAAAGEVDRAVEPVAAEVAGAVDAVGGIAGEEIGR